MTLWTADAPSEVKAAITLAWVVLLIDAILNLWQIVLDVDVRGELWFLLFLTAIALASYALTGLFIFYASRRRNWARIAFLIWTVASWSLWYFFPQEISAFPWWEWFASGSLVAMEVCVLILLFRSQANSWYGFLQIS